jgi:hypothetical protein
VRDTEAPVIDLDWPGAIICRMDKEPPSRPRPATPSPKLIARKKREADALRTNLRKRKDQARAREKPKQE